MGSSRAVQRRLAVALTVVVAAAEALTGCPRTRPAARDGGAPCTTDLECSAGNACGTVYYCVVGFCSVSSTIVACGDGGYPDSGPSGNCATYQDCNPLGACGAVIDCVDYRCTPDAATIRVPCADAGSEGGATDGGDAQADADAAGDAPSGDGSDDGFADVSTDGG